MFLSFFLSLSLLFTDNLLLLLSFEFLFTLTLDNFVLATLVLIFIRKSINRLEVNFGRLEGVHAFTENFLNAGHLKQTKRVGHLSDVQLDHVEDKLQLVLFVVTKVADEGFLRFIKHFLILQHTFLYLVANRLTLGFQVTRKFVNLYFFLKEVVDVW